MRNENEKEKKMMREEGRILGTKEEIAEGKLKLDLGELGEFMCIYLIPCERGIYGIWHPSKKLEEKLGKFLGKKPYMTKLHYVLPESEKEKEEELIKSEDAKLSDFLALNWSDWYLGYREIAGWLL